MRAYVRGAKVRVCGEARLGLVGPERVHPRCRVLRQASPLPETLTPVYPTTAGLAQDPLRKLVQKALAEISLEESLPREILRRLRLPAFRESVLYLHQPPPAARLALLDNRSDPAWRRIKFDELLAPQLSIRLHYRPRRA